MKDLGDSSSVLEIHIHRDQSSGIIGLSQRSYIKNVLKRFRIQEYKLGNTPMAKGENFSLN